MSYTNFLAFKDAVKEPFRAPSIQDAQLLVADITTSIESPLSKISMLRSNPANDEILKQVQAFCVEVRHVIGDVSEQHLSSPSMP